ncbi:MAG: DNA oxidative demethylase AlkB [Rhodomicrobium sp.]
MKQDTLPDLFDATPEPEPRVELASGAVLLRGFALDCALDLLAGLESVIAEAPFRHMVTPGGQSMSVAMTNCGAAGWITDRRGYRYERVDPLTGKAWPDMPLPFLSLAQRAALEGGYQGFEPDACLINRYEPGSQLTLHQDKNERDYAAPIVSVALGLPAKFLFGGMERSAPVRRIMLHHGDTVVWGGPSRLAFHGIDTLKDGNHPATGHCRINLTFRKAL